MSRSLIYTVNQSAQTVPADGLVAPGSVIRRFGCNLNLSGNSIEARGEGYYSLDASIVCTPAAAGNITATLLKDGVPIPGATSTSSVTTIGNSVTLPISTVIRETCCGDSASAITCVLSAAATVNNYAFRGVRE